MMRKKKIYLVDIVSLRLPQSEKYLISMRLAPFLGLKTSTPLGKQDSNKVLPSTRNSYEENSHTINRKGSCLPQPNKGLSRPRIQSA